MTILYKLDKGNHSVYALQYHFVQCVKYRKKALVNEAVVDLLKNQVHRISETFAVEALNIEADKDHFHLLFKGHPKLELVKYINAIKTITAREIRRTHPELKAIIWGDHFWSPSYFLATTGQVTLDALKRYVENQGKDETRTGENQ
jgi:putative transposase